jgi:hypothetical protein
MSMLRCGFVKSMWEFVEEMRRFSGRGIVVEAARGAVGSIKRFGKTPARECGSSHLTGIFATRDVWCDFVASCWSP